ncbi:MAG: TonB-dependent receptor [Pirellulales bacterium]|nr:TonB-dependent receptor [Pirellulales bacterium]
MQFRAKIQKRGWGIWGLLLFSNILAAGQPIVGQEAASPSSVAQPGPESPPGDKLDKLLEMADKDLSQLSQVPVNRGTGSPSLDVPVSTVARQESTVGKSAAAVYVITNEMIRRSGAKTIPDVLRLAPGVDVARIDSNKWAISIRGFNVRFANQLLVQIDGRSVYTVTFGGVFWDVQDLLLEDVERIEVIRGPGSAMWGSNAVNGIINIITKRAKDTQGTYFENGTGTQELGYSGLRCGGGNGDDLHYRFYGKWFERGAGFNPDGPAYDDWRQARGGFRADWNATREDTITFQGDYYNGYSGDQSIFPQFSDPYYSIDHDSAHVSGENALLRWRRVVDEQSDTTLWMYYDRTERHWVNYGFGIDRDTFDVNFQRRRPLGARHELIWGFEYRTTGDSTYASPFVNMIPPRRSDYFLSYFAQDQIAVVEDRWFLILGCRFEHNSYVDFNYQPTVRVLWTPDDRHSIWGAVSRAVRMPTRTECNALFTAAPVVTDPDPVYPQISGNPYLLAEESIAYEWGYRTQVTERFSWDLAVFYQDYQQCIVIVPAGFPEPAPVGSYLPMGFQNAMCGETYGFEWAVDYVMTSRWKMRGAYSFLVMDLAPVPGTDTAEVQEGESPRNQFYVCSSWDLGDRWELDLIGRYVDNLPTAETPHYFVGDVRLAWRPRENLEWSVVGRNLLDGAHPEFGNDQILGTLRTDVRQEVYTQLIWRR